MNDFEKNIYDRIPKIHEEALRRRADEEISRAQAREMKAAAREQFEREVALSRQLAETAVELLLREGVADVPIIVTRRSGYTHEVSRGWLIASTHIYGPQHYGLNHRADLLSFSRTSITNNGQEWSGIIGPRAITDGPEKLKTLQDEKFSSGIASLIAGYGPYSR